MDYWHFIAVSTLLLYIDIGCSGKSEVPEGLTLPGIMQENCSMSRGSQSQRSVKTGSNLTGLDKDCKSEEQDTEPTFEFINLDKECNSGVAELFAICDVNIKDFYQKKCTSESSIIVSTTKTAVVYITCYSKYELDINAYFDDGTPTYLTTDIAFKQYEVNSTTDNSYREELTSLYAINLLWRGWETATRFVITLVDDTLEVPGSASNITITLLHWDEGRDSRYHRYWMDNRAYNLEARTTTISAFATDKVISIPCIFAELINRNRSSLFAFPTPYLRKLHLVELEVSVELPVDNKSIKFRSDIGYLIYPEKLKNIRNITISEMGFLCAPDIPKYKEYYTFVIETRKAKIYPAEHTVLLIQSYGDDVQEYFNNNPPVFTCEYTSPIKICRKINPKLARWENKGGHPNYVEPIETSGLRIECNYSTRLEPSRNFASFELKPIELFDNLTLRCELNTTNSTKSNKQPYILHEWIVLVPTPAHTYEQLSMSLNEKEITCRSLIYNDIQISAMLCGNPIQCKLMQPCLDKASRIHCKGLVYYGHDCEPTSFGFCKKIIVPEKGSVFCSAGDYKTWQPVFTGFDGKSHFFNPTCSDEKRLPGMRGYVMYDSCPLDDNYRMKLTSVNSSYVRTTFNITCEAISMYTGGPISIKVEPSTLVRRTVKRNVLNVEVVSSFIQSPFTGLVLNPVKKISINLQVPGTYTIGCMAPYRSSVDGIEQYIEHSVIEPTTPTIESKNATNVYGIFGQPVTFPSCKAIGDPPPDIYWLKNNVKDEGSSVLTFRNFTADLVGNYTCEAKNFNGVAKFTYQLLVKEDRGDNMLVTVVAFIATAAFMVLVSTLILYKWFYTPKSYKVEEKDLLSTDDIDVFDNGNKPNYGYIWRDEEPIQEPYNKQFEAQARIKFGSLLSTGNYGEVYSGYYKGDIVAIKTRKSHDKRDVSKKTLKALALELKTCIQLQQNANIENRRHLVKLICAKTSNLRNGILYVVLEFCVAGSIESHLQKLVENRQLGTQSKFFQWRQRNNINWLDPIARLKREIPVECNEGDFQRWCYETALGMEYMAESNVVHRDLAIRNILLTFDPNQQWHCSTAKRKRLIAKICDFGISRQLVEELYQKQYEVNDAHLHQMAPESLRDMKFTTKSDVWAFGIVMWQIYTFGQPPYQENDMTARQLLDRIEDEEFLLERPDICCADDQEMENGMYELMKECWKIDPNIRPTFTKLREELQLIMSMSMHPTNHCYETSL